MQFTLIAALSENRVIGNHNKLPWYIPEDLPRFKKLTLDHTVIMGRKTFSSILERLHKPLPQRKNIVMTLNPHFNDSRVIITRSVDQTKEYCDPDKENFVIGGQKIYELFLPLSQKMELTLVKGYYPGDAFFPVVNGSEWEEKQREDKRDDCYEYSFIRYERKLLH